VAFAKSRAIPTVPQAGTGARVRVTSAIHASKGQVHCPIQSLPEMAKSGKFKLKKRRIKQ
jgi:hypothetical protein